jgi:ethanolamine permease
MSQADPSTPPQLGWKQIASLGVAIAISGNFSGWNYGLAAGGWGGMFVAALLMGFFYVCLTGIVGELAAALPAAEGFDAYVGRSLGREWGGAAGFALFAGLAVGTGLAVSFIAAYAQSISGIGGWPLKLGLIAAVLLLQARGARDSVRATFLAGGVSLLILIAFCLYMIPYFQTSNLLGIGAGGRPQLFEGGFAGALGCVPFALFFFIGVEQAALAAGEAEDAARSVPRALTAAVITALGIGFAVLIVATGGAGVDRLTHSDDPLFTAVSAASGSAAVRAAASRVLGLGAVISLLATFFSLSYAASRQLRALALDRLVPEIFSRTNRRHAPHAALAAVAIIGIGAAAFDPDTVMVLFVFLLNLSYQLTIAGFVALRRREPRLARPVRAFGGTPAALASALLSMAVLVACARQRPAVIAAAVLITTTYGHIARSRCSNMIGPSNEGTQQSGRTL